MNHETHEALFVPHKGEMTIFTPDARWVDWEARVVTLIDDCNDQVVYRVLNGGLTVAYGKCSQMSRPRNQRATAIAKAFGSAAVIFGRAVFTGRRAAISRAVAEASSGEQMNLPVKEAQGLMARTSDAQLVGHLARTYTYYLVAVAAAEVYFAEVRYAGSRRSMWAEERGLQ